MTVIRNDCNAPPIKSSQQLTLQCCTDVRSLRNTLVHAIVLLVTIVNRMGTTIPQLLRLHDGSLSELSVGQLSKEMRGQHLD